MEYLLALTVPGRSTMRAIEVSGLEPPWERNKTTASRAIEFLTSLRIPEGPKAGEPLRLARFQEQFVNGALADGVNMACLSIGRGNAKTALSAGVALGTLVGAFDKQPKAFRLNPESLWVPSRC
ncbi:hypothetical protein KTN05_17550 [Paracoccus sp. Z118]|uniref:hypothetical protein n=1 Tax=Paracoccus sp. Z118 TaxID=2851017 RepID=UPI001C2C812E|nr:hypothetical protein [Paracoccus sp. Z118]MBV0893584.1 hypothetical protein [Paracoccus sp. Z118]